VCALLCLAAFVAWCVVGGATVQSWEALVSFWLAQALIFTVCVKDLYYFWAPFGEGLSGLMFLLSAGLLVIRPTDGPSPRWRVFLAGALVGLTVYAKVIMVIAAAGLGIGLAAAALRRRFERAALAWWLAGVLGTVVVVELFKLSTLGSLAAYGRQWQDFLFRITAPGSGAGWSGGRQLLEQFQLHAQAWDQYLGLFGVLLPLPLLLLVLAAARATGPFRVEERLAAALGLPAALLLAWWFLRSEGEIIRRVVPALVLLPVVAHFAVMGLAQRWQSLPRLAVPSLWVVAVGLAAVLSPAGTCRLPMPGDRLSERTTALLSFAERLKEVRDADPSARFWSYGWWRHWDVRLLVDVPLHDFRRPTPSLTPIAGRGKNYLITSDVFNIEKGALPEAVIAANARFQVYRNAFFALYELRAPPAASRDRPARCRIIAHGLEASEPWLLDFLAPDRHRVAWFKTDAPVPLGAALRCGDVGLATVLDTSGRELKALIPRELLDGTPEVVIELYDPWTGSLFDSVRLAARR
jgi:hypothetical protein